MAYPLQQVQVYKRVIVAKPEPEPVLTCTHDIAYVQIDLGGVFKRINIV